MKEKHHRRRPWLACLLILLLLAGTAGGTYTLYRETVNAAEDYYRSRYLTFDFSNEGYDYSESTAKLKNPGGSFYNLAAYLLSENTSEKDLAKRLREDIKEYKDEELVLIEINLMNYNDRALSDNALMQTETILKTWGEKGYGIILRFLYDWSGNAAATEPQEPALVKTHMDQVAPIVNANAEYIYTLQGIFVGDYAEMHGGHYTDNESMCALAAHLDSVIDPDIFLSVRTPAQRRMILGSDEVMPENNTLAQRLGLFNDGMLGSGDDLGTYGDTDRSQATAPGDQWLRDQELDYQDALCRFVPNGGEVVIDNPLNDLDQAVITLSTMHVSYLNCMYQEEVIDKWRENTVHTTDVWDGTKGYDYIDAHLGARYRCSGTAAGSFDFWSEDAATLELTFTNTGFSDFYEPLALTVTVVPDKRATAVTQTECESDELETITNKETCTVSLPLKLRDYADGAYRIYISCVRAESETSIEFASNLPQSEFGYEVASFSIDRTPTTIPPAEELLERYLAHRRSSKNSLAK